MLKTNGINPVKTVFKAIFKKTKYFSYKQFVHRPCEPLVFTFTENLVKNAPQTKY